MLIVPCQICKLSDPNYSHNKMTMAFHSVNLLPKLWLLYFTFGKEENFLFKLGLLLCWRGH